MACAPLGLGHDAERAVDLEHDELTVRGSVDAVLTARLVKLGVRDALVLHAAREHLPMVHEQRG